MTLDVVPRPGIGVDRTLIREALRTTQEERILAAGRAGRALKGVEARSGRCWFPSLGWRGV